MYITHPTHGAGARPSKTQAPTATRLTTPNADQCVHQPRGGRGRNRQTPLKKQKKQGGGGTRKAHSHETAHPHHKRLPNPPARRHQRRDPPKEHLRTTQPKAATPNRERRPTGRKDTPNTPTHTLLGRRRAKENTHEGAALTRGEGRTETTRLKTGTASDGHHKATTRQSQKPHPPPQPEKKKKNQQGGWGKNPTHRNDRTPPGHRRPPRR